MSHYMNEYTPEAAVCRSIVLAFAALGGKSFSDTQSGSQTIARAWREAHVPYVDVTSYMIERMVKRGEIQYYKLGNKAVLANHPDWFDSYRLTKHGHAQAAIYKQQAQLEQSLLRHAAQSERIVNNTYEPELAKTFDRLALLGHLQLGAIPLAQPFAKTARCTVTATLSEPGAQRLKALNRILSPLTSA